jgi:hypothetical protein
LRKKELKIKQILEQLVDLREEYKDKKGAIERLEEYIAKLEQEGYSEIDSVTGGNGGKQHFLIEGFPYPLYSKKKTQLQMRKMALEEIKKTILEQITIAEKLINEQENSRIRRLLTYRYIDDMSWIQIATRMGGKHTADSCRVTVERFFKEQQKNQN